MEDTARVDLSTKPTRVRKDFGLRINELHRPGPELIAELLTAHEARLRFGLRNQRLYAMVKAGLVHPVRPNGRVLYPEWEIAAAMRAGYGPLAIALGEMAA